MAEANMMTNSLLSAASVNFILPLTLGNLDDLILGGEELEVTVHIDMIDKKCTMHINHSMIDKKCTMHINHSKSNIAVLA